jgi:hypothetical protein
MENDRWLSLLLRLLRCRVGIRGDEPGRCIIVGERVSATYCGPDGSRIEERRGAEEEEGYCRWCLLARLEVPDIEDVVDSLLLAPRRCGARGTLPRPERSPVRPTTLPISVDVRSMDMTPGADARRSCLSLPACCLYVARDTADRLDALLVRPLALGSRSVSIVPPSVGTLFRKLY